MAQGDLNEKVEELFAPVEEEATDGHGTEKMYKTGCRCRPCKNAHAAWWRIYQTERGEKLGLCTQPGCSNTQYAKKLCKPHYQRQRREMDMTAPIVPKPNLQESYPRKRR